MEVMEEDDTKTDPCDSTSISLWTLCSKLCCIFCCPPCLPCITSKLAFHPPNPSYRFEQANNSPDQKLKFVVNAEEEPAWDIFGDVLNNMEVFYANSSRGNKIACLYIRYWTDARYTILMSHGNSVDIGLSSHFLRLLCQFLHCNILTYDYSGYGASSGNPSESNLYTDIAAAWQSLTGSLGVSPEQVILYGFSIGSVPTVDLAAKHKVGGVVLHSALLSGLRLFFPRLSRTWSFDPFPNIEKVAHITSPTLVIHGVRDETINIYHGQALYERCTNAVTPLWVEDGDHNNLSEFKQYWRKLCSVLDNDFGTQREITKS